MWTCIHNVTGGHMGPAELLHHSPVAPLGIELRCSPSFEDTRNICAHTNSQTSSPEFLIVLHVGWLTLLTRRDLVAGSLIVCKAANCFFHGRVFSV